MPKIAFDPAVAAAWCIAGTWLAIRSAKATSTAPFDSPTSTDAAMTVMWSAATANRARPATPRMPAACRTRTVPRRSAMAPQTRIETSVAAAPAMPVIPIDANPRSKRSTMTSVTSGTAVAMPPPNSAWAIVSWRTLGWSRIEWMARFTEKGSTAPRSEVAIRDVASARIGADEAADRDDERAIGFCREIATNKQREPGGRVATRAIRPKAGVRGRPPGRRCPTSAAGWACRRSAPSRRRTRPRRPT